MPNFCPNCGIEITEKVKFCPECGADISSFLKKPDETENIQETKSEIKTENEAPDKEEPNNKNILKTILIYFCAGIGIVVLLLIISAFVAGMIAGLQSHSSQQLTTNQIPSTPTYAVSTYTPIPTLTPTISSTKSAYTKCIEKYAGTSADIITLCENEAGLANQYVSPIPTTQYIQPVGITSSQEANRAKLIAQAIDWESQTVHNFALQQVQRSSSGTYNIAQICDVWQSIFNQWTYVSDPPTFNYFTSASDSINNGLKGNCADYAILNAAVTESIGGSARVITACAPGGSPCHAYAEVLIDPSSLQAIANYIGTRYGAAQVHWHISTNSQGNKQYWLNLDWSANYPGGPFF
jgi:hypothetical protein